jgi:hypothetical protein
MRKCFPKIPRRNSGHAHRGHGLHLVKAERQKLAVGDGINVGVVRAGSVPRHHQRHAFVQIVNNRRVPLVKHAMHGLGGFVCLLVSVTIDVDERILRPVGRRLARERVAVGPALEVAIEPVDHLVAAVGIGNGIDQNDDSFPDPPNHRLLRHRQSVGQLNHGLGRAGFVGMQRGVEVINGTRVGDELFSGCGVGAPGIRQRSGRPLQPVEITNPSLIGDCEHQHFASFAVPDVNTRTADWPPQAHERA